MVIKKIVKRIASTILAVAITATTITGTFASAAIDPNPISTTPTNISFSFTEGHISATSVRNVYGVRAAGASLTQYTKLTHTQDFWIIHPNNQTYSNLCINPNATVNSGAQPYYAYQVTSGSMEANSSYWENLDDNVKYTIGLIMHYGYPNGNKGGFAMGGGQDSHGAACFEATQMLVWEAVSGMRVLPSDYKNRRDSASGFYHSYASTQWHYTDGKKDYQYSPLIDFFTKSGDASLTQNTINYYKYLVEKIAHHIDIPEIPELARGTVVPANYGEFLAVLGDNKREAEVVAPYSTIVKAVKDEQGSSKGGAMTVVVNIQTKNGLRTLGQVSIDEINDIIDSTGTVPIRI